MSDIAASAVATNVAQTQMALAAAILKQNADSGQAVADLIEQSAANLEAAVAATPPGTGANVNITV